LRGYWLHGIKMKLNDLEKIMLKHDFIDIEGGVSNKEDIIRNIHGGLIHSRYNNKQTIVYLERMKKGKCKYAIYEIMPTPKKEYKK